MYVWRTADRRLAGALRKKKPWPANFRRALKALDPSQFFVVTFALFCNGEVRG